MSKVARYFLISLLIFILLAVPITFIFIKWYKQKHPPLEVITSEIEAGETLLSVLKNNNLEARNAIQIIAALEKVFDTRRLHPGDKYELTIEPNGNLNKFVYYASPTNIFVVQPDKEGNLFALRQEIPLTKVTRGLKGEITTSLYEAITSANEPPDLVMYFADIFSWEIDFFTDPRVKDTFRLVYDKHYKNTQFIANGQILAAQYNNAGKIYTAIYFEDPEGHKDYYDLEGKSLRKAFLRSPLNYRKITSYFSRRRFHPILKIYRPHFGIDYAAPTGTPLVSIGDGLVIYAGWYGGFGRYIKIRHPNGFCTTYGHLSRYARGIRTGARVKQGQVIGYVGSSGLSTGPHLDFRILKDKKYVNFLGISLPKANAIAPKYIADFEKVKQERLALLETLPDKTYQQNAPPQSFWSKWLSFWRKSS